MQSQFVFQNTKEIKRLRVQNSLLYPYEVPVLAQIFSEGHDLAVLDVGCNDGSKTVSLFSSDSVSHVIGLEYNDKLAVKAQETYGNERFSFYALNVEEADLVQKLESIMNDRKIDGFDVIYLSFVLMHLSDPKQLLYVLKSVLKENGKLFIVEANDRASVLSNDTDGLLSTFLEILKKDPYSGNRDTGADIGKILLDCGYKNLRVWHDAIAACEGETEKKEAIFTMFFSYLPEDIALLLASEPDNEEYREWLTWSNRNHKKLKHLILQDESVISMGMQILTCMKGKE